MELEARGIGYRYGKGKPWILKDFCMRAGGGERVGITAPSGRGKTTLCKVLAGYGKPWEGEVLLDGKNLDFYGRYCPVQLVWQHPELAVNPRMRMGAVLSEGDGVEERIVRGLGIRKEWMERFPGELSGGELQRFCIARALGKGTRFLVADEITAMLDLVTQWEIWEFVIEETEKREIGLLVVSHHEALLRSVCTRKMELPDIREGV